MAADAALNVTSLLIQLCGLSVELYGKYRDQQDRVTRLADVGLVKELDELSSWTNFLTDSPLLTNTNDTSIIAQYNQHAIDLSLTTAKAVDNLSGALRKLSARPEQSRAESFMKAWKSIVNGGKLQQLKDEVDHCRQRAIFLQVSLISEKVDVSLKQQARILKSQKEHFDLSQRNSTDIRRLLTFQSHNKHSMILEMKDGRVQALETGTDFLRGRAQARPLPSSVTFFKPASAGHDAEATTCDSVAIISRVRKCLHFERLTERQNVIKEAHFTTFNWIFEENTPASKVGAFSSFPQWLEHGRGCYWIQGKAGSGKSTLVKRIHEHEETQRYLRRWCKESTLLTASYFFWYMGTSLQKTMEGMLRSLLFSLLEKEPHLVLSALPALFIEASKIQGNESLPSQSFPQLLEGFNRLIQACELSQKIKICFFIDGLDECSSNKTDLANFLLELGARSSMVKVVMSSRPLASFVDIFSGVPGLLVQDLTKSDIEGYTRSLIPTKRYTVSNDDVQDLIETISERSQGVFLWVTVVVQTVLEGLRHGDTVAELQSRVKRLPAELKDLYRRMLEDINKEYRTHAAEMLLLVAIAFDPMHPVSDVALIYPFPAIQLSFALEGCDAATEAPIEHLPNEDIQHRIKALEPRLRSRCLGLIELRDCHQEFETPQGTRTGGRLSAIRVEPFHRTAVEFLLDEEVSDFLVSQASKDFNAFSSLFCSTIRMAKIATWFDPTSLGTTPVDLPPSRHLLEALFLVTDAVRRHHGIEKKYIDELDRVLSLQWTAWAQLYAPPFYQTSHWMSALLLNRRTSQGDWIGEDKDHFSLDLDDHLCAQLFARCDEIGFLIITTIIYRPDDLRLLMRSCPRLAAEDATLLLRLLLQARFNPRGTGAFRVFLKSDTYQAVAALLALGADPNAPDTEDPSLTLWTLFLRSIYDLFACKGWALAAEDGGANFIAIVQEFVNYGADLSATILWRDDPLLPSVYTYTLYLLATEGVAMFTGDSAEAGDGLIARRFVVMAKPLEKTAQYLRAQEERAGIHDSIRAPQRWLKAARKFLESTALIGKDETQSKNTSPSSTSTSTSTRVSKWATWARSLGWGWETLFWMILLENVSDFVLSYSIVLGLASLTVWLPCMLVHRLSSA